MKIPNFMYFMKFNVLRDLSQQCCSIMVFSKYKGLRLLIVLNISIGQSHSFNVDCPVRIFN